MPGLYSITNRVSGELITATKYNADHQNHADNFVPTMMDDYSSSASQMQSASDAGESGSESLPTSMAGELERLRFAIAEIKGEAIWYSTADADLNLLTWGVLS